jgi:hypothetical protein
MSDHTHVFCPGCREDSDRLAALRDEIMTLQVVGAAVDLSYRRADATARAQLAEEMEARRSEREATTRLAESQHRYVAQVKQRDQQIAALRELFSLENTTDDDGQCISCWTDIGDPERPEPHSTNCVLERARALVVAAGANIEDATVATIGLRGRI